ncbi:hypothetical protein ACFQ3B_06035 [Stackebrandtia endophytica]|uniref:hypothetical protein n=1 Tax=Stackebrandtia endophytica TaxID=1496996 RepID=UPI001150F5E2|nr:hypothetical protein [Stackebrandtia endophytica]
MSQLEAIEARLERARFIAMSAISGLHGSGTVAKSGDQADDPTSWNKPKGGNELVEDKPTPRRRGSRIGDALREATRNADELHSAAKQNVGQAFDVANSYTKLPDPPSQTVTSTQARPPQPPAYVDTSSAKASDIAGGITLTAVALLTGAHHLVKMLRNRKRQDD